jgi:hypothetical protein
MFQVIKLVLISFALIAQPRFQDCLLKATRKQDLAIGIAK